MMDKTYAGLIYIPFLPLIFVVAIFIVTLRAIKDIVGDIYTQVVYRFVGRQE